MLPSKKLLVVFITVSQERIEYKPIKRTMKSPTIKTILITTQTSVKRKPRIEKKIGAKKAAIAKSKTIVVLNPTAKRNKLAKVIRTFKTKFPVETISDLFSVEAQQFLVLQEFSIFFIKIFVNN